MQTFALRINKIFYLFLTDFKQGYRGLFAWFIGVALARPFAKKVQRGAPVCRAMFTRMLPARECPGPGVQQSGWITLVLLPWRSRAPSHRLSGPHVRLRRGRSWSRRPLCTPGTIDAERTLTRNETQTATVRPIIPIQSLRRPILASVCANKHSNGRPADSKYVFFCPETPSKPRGLADSTIQAP
jgi:hypothetical protein